MTIQQLQSKGFKLKMGHIKKTVRDITHFFILEKKDKHNLYRFITWSHNNKDYVEPVRLNNTMKKLLREYEVVK